MANNRDIKLDEYGISRFAYRELKYFCLQYSEKKQKMLNGDKNASADVSLIEETAAEVDSAIYSYLLQAVTSGKSYIQLKMTWGIPCGKDYFNKRRRKFFNLLAKRRGLM